MFSSQQIRLLKRLVFLIIPYSLLRLGFYFYHHNIYKDFGPEEVCKSFLWGVRFDVAAILLVNAIPILLSFVSTFNRKFLIFERVLFIFLNTFAVLIAVDDFELFLFMGKRFSLDLFVIGDDILQQLPQLLVNYWYLPVGVGLFGFGYYFYDKKFFRLNERKAAWFSHVTGVLLLAVFFVGIRGGFQHKSINIQSAFVQGKNELGHLVLNSPYHFLRTLKNKTIVRVKYFSSDEEAKKVILGERDLKKSFGEFRRANVVLVILESISLEYMEKGYTPFLDELKAKSLYFPNHLANGRRSIEALPSLLCGLPSLLGEPISKSVFAGNKFNCMPKILKEAGYTNYFFHAGARGTMGFESYTLANGFDRYFSRDEYGRSDFDGTWGVFDLPYLQYVASEMSKIQEPFLAGAFTLSSHQPYAIPAELKNKFPKGTLPIHESVGYSDFALREFFKTAEKTSWFKNTVFIVTSDHSQILESKKFMNMVGRYRVPLLIYGPGIKSEKSLKVTQHSDIPDSVLDYLGINSELPGTSVSVFSKDSGAAVNFADGSTYFLASKNNVQTLEQDFLYDWETGEMKENGENKNPLLKAYLQYFINGLIGNNLSLYR